MRVALITSVILAGVIVASLAPSCEAQSWKDAAVEVASKLVGLWRNGNLNFLGHDCNYTVKPTIRRWQLYYKGKMWCQGWTSIVGEGLTRSNSGAVQVTTEDFARKAFAAGLITEEQAKVWLKS